MTNTRTALTATKEKGASRARCSRVRRSAEKKIESNDESDDNHEPDGDEEKAVPTPSLPTANSQMATDANEDATVGGEPPRMEDPTALFEGEDWLAPAKPDQLMEETGPRGRGAVAAARTSGDLGNADEMDLQGLGEALRKMYNRVCTLQREHTPEARAPQLETDEQRVMEELPNDDDERAEYGRDARPRYQDVEDSGGGRRAPRHHEHEREAPERAVRRRHDEAERRDRGRRHENEQERRGSRSRSEARRRGEPQEHHDRHPVQRRAQQSGDPSGDDSSDDSERGRRGPPSDSGSSSETSSGSSSDESDQSGSRSARRGYERRDRYEQRDRHGRPEQREREERRRRATQRGIKDLELPVFTPEAGISVSTWIDRIDLALEGARESGRGDWSDKSLYFILGNKLAENAARWWVNRDRRTPARERTWTHLKRGQLQMYAPPQNLEDAEWRVNTRMMIAGESYADYAAGLREAADRNPVEERVFLVQFYRNLDRTTRQLVKQQSVPRTLEKAVEKATQLSNQLENVARGMHNIGQTFPAAHVTHLLQVNNPSGTTVMIPDAGRVSVPGEVAGATTETGGRTTADTAEQLGLFTKLQGVYNRLTGMTQMIPGRR
ncbi:hypothetical protein P3T76_009074 [Phytophthora citrophthora]|uniref:Retrotransposon gag domain-containing protein n=1 Tax=Phytophthora citrophthora TaxID=4793 RepID=A0AAD9GI51_9STRA|nr:hypothetical protein P3T76_009074 [Phytophthora citrophthora]